jgi:Putative MetA-pathway of phenol degradation
MKINLTKLAAAAGVLTLSAAGSAMAGSVSQPGAAVGGAAGMPLPPGFYFADTVDWGVRDIPGEKTAVGVNIPVLTWSTPWKILGAQLSFTAIAPSVEVGVVGGPYNEGMFNPFFGAKLAWNLGGGLGVAYALGGYAGVNNVVNGIPIGFDTSSVVQEFAVSYVANGWNLTGNLAWGIQSNGLTNTVNPDWLNIDLTATKKFGKWELGAVAFGSTDLNQPDPLVAKQSQFALGGLVGYNFGPVILQSYLTRDVSQSGYGGFDTRLWSRVIIPLGDPLGASPSSGPMYRK